MGSNNSKGFNELVRFVESLIKPSVVLIEFDGKTFQTGFFVSCDGLVCTCYHGALLRKEIRVRWNDRSYPTHTIFSAPEKDLLLLSIHDSGEESVSTPPLPIYDGLLMTEFYHDALSVGYSGAGVPGFPISPQPFKGFLTSKYNIERQERLNIRGISKDKGNSGAPVFDLQLLRVVAYVRASYKRTKKISGDALTFNALLREHPELAEEWRKISQECDLKIARHFRSVPFQLDLKSCPEGFVSGLIFEHRANIIESHYGYKLFQNNRYVARSVENDVQDFLEKSSSGLLLLAGASGTGKTSLLLQLAQQFDRANYLPVFINCSGQKTQSLLKELFTALLPGEYFNRSRLRDFFGRCPNKKWVLIFDGINECAEFSRKEFKIFVDNLTSFAQEENINSKVILSLRSEFLREYLPEVFFWRDLYSNEQDFDYTLFYRDNDGQPYVDIGRINKTVLPDEKLELQVMYERYCETGLKPSTSFEQLSEPILRMLDRPFILDLMMKTYQGREIPLRIGRSKLIRKIVSKALTTAGIEQSSTTSRMEGYLGKLAIFILRLNKDLKCSENELQNQTWYRGKEFDKLLASTPFLEKEVTRRSFGDESFIKFGADWAFEFFIARYLWNEWWNKDFGKKPDHALSSLHTLLPEVNNRIDSQHLLIALVFFAEWTFTDDPARFSFLVAVMNDFKHESLAKGFTHECLDFFRVNYSFNNFDTDNFTTLLKHLSDNSEGFNKTGVEGILDYVEYLETIGEYKNALDLLDLDVYGSVIKENPQLKARRQLSLALNTLLNNEMDKMLSHIQKFEFQNLPPELLSKHAFVVGRAYQYKEDFSAAKIVFNLGMNGMSLYAYKCEHQLAYIKLASESNYLEASELLKNILKDTNSVFSLEQKHASSLLLATCLFRIGNYTEAEAQLDEIISIQTSQRNKHGLGKSLRALAEVHARKFEHRKSLEVIDKSIEALTGGPPLSLATALDTKANILGLLVGDSEGARSYNRKSLELCEEKKHRPTRQWCLQTSALLSALEGNLDTTSKLLNDAGVKNPFEALLERFIYLLALHCGGQSTGADFITKIRTLQSDFLELHLVWYPGILSLIEWAAASKIPDKTEIAAQFPREVNVEGIISSHLYARIFSAR